MILATITESTFQIYTELGKLGVLGVIVAVLIYLLVLTWNDKKVQEEIHRSDIKEMNKKFCESYESISKDYKEHVDELIKSVMEVTKECSQAMAVQVEVLRSLEKTIDNAMRKKHDQR